MLNVYEKSMYTIGQNVKFYFGMRVHEGTIVNKNMKSDGCWYYDIDVGRMAIGRGIYSYISEDDVLKSRSLFCEGLEDLGRNYI